MKLMNLCLHTGARSVSREAVIDVPTPTPTATWVPVPHDRLLTSVEQALGGAGLHVVSQAHGITREGARYFGLLQVANGQNDADFGLIVGLRNSHDQSFPAGLVIGANVFVCDNLSFSGEVRLARRHTVHIGRDLPQLVNRAVGRLQDLRTRQSERFGAYRQREFSDSQAHDLVIRALDNRVVPVTKVPLVLKEWRTPRHPEFRDGKTAWRLFNAFTEAVKGNLDELPRRTQALHGLMDLACGLNPSLN